MMLSKLTLRTQVERFYDRIRADETGRDFANHVKDLLYQPEAESKAGRKPTDLRLVASCGDSQGPVARRSGLQPGDDPGPSAA